MYTHVRMCRELNAATRIMLFRLLLFAIFLLTVCNTCVRVYCENHDKPKMNSVTLFAPEKRILKNENNSTYEIVVSFWTPFLVAADGVIVTITTKLANDFFDDPYHIVARYIQTDGEYWAESVTDANGNKWSNSSAVHTMQGNDIFLVIGKSFVAVGKGKKIYIFLVMERVRNPNADKDESMVPEDIVHNGHVAKNEEINENFVFDKNWVLELVVGEVSGEKGNKAVTWQTPQSLNHTALSQQLRERSLKMSAAHDDGYGFLTDDGVVVFVVKAETSSRNVTAVIHSKSTEGGDEVEWALSYVGAAEDCYDRNSIFPWGGKLIMITHCAGDNTHTVRESSDVGRTWRDSEGPFAKLYGDLMGKSNFTTATLDNRSVLLFIGEIKKDEQQRPELHLWVSDANNVHDLGAIVADAEPIAHPRLLYTDGELFYSYQILLENDNISFAVVFTHLKDEVGKIRSVLGGWDAMYESVARLCTDDNSAAPCATPMPTVGLVGLLSDGDASTLSNGGRAPMKPEVKGDVTKVKNGFKFSGPGAGARWSVRGPATGGGQSSIARSGLTFVASVNIDSLAGNGGTSLMGVGMSDMSRVGLRCTRDGRWALDGGEERTTILTNERCEVNRTYRLALTLRDGSVAAYIDWEPLKGVDKKSMRMARLQSISHVYVGADSNDGEQSRADSRMTVTGVLLYSRPFEKTEIDVLKSNRLRMLNAGNTAHVAAVRRDGTQTLPSTLSARKSLGFVCVGCVLFLPFLLLDMCGAFGLFGLSDIGYGYLFYRH